MRYFLTFTFIVIISCSNDSRIRYELVHPIYSGEQYLTIIDSNIFYHGKAKEIKLIDSEDISFLYFISKEINKRKDKNEINISFYNFQYSPKPLKISNWDSLEYTKNDYLFSTDIYNSMWGKTKGDIITLNATKHLYGSKFDSINFRLIK